MNDINTIEPKMKNKEFKIPKRKAIYLLLFVSFFSNTVLRTEENLVLYIALSIFICIGVYFRILVKPSRLTKAIINKFTAWLLVLFSMYFFYGLILPTYFYFNGEYFLFMFIMTIITLLLFIDIPKAIMMEIFIKVCAITSLAVSIFILVNEWSLIIEGSTRIGDSGSGNVITIATYLGMMSLPSLYKLVFEKKLVYILPYALSTTIMLLTGSKLAFYFIVIALMVLLLLKNGYRIQKYIIPLIFVLIIFFLIFNNEYLFNIIGFRIIDFLGTLGFNVEGADSSYSTNSRLTMISAAIEAFRDKPIFGGGWYFFAEHSGLGIYSHNNYLEILTTYGIVGFSIYYSMFIITFLKLATLVREDDYAKLLVTLLFSMFLVDISSISFSINVLNYQVIAVSFLYLIKKNN